MHSSTSFDNIQCMDTQQSPPDEKQPSGVSHNSVMAIGDFKGELEGTGPFVEK